MRIAIILFLIPLLASAQKYPKLEKLILESHILGENLINLNVKREVLVYLPASYDSPNKKFPVLYLLHGWGEDHMGWLSSPYTQGFNLGNSMDSLIEAGIINEMIVVIPDCSNPLGGSWYANSSSGGMWEDFFIKELVHLVDMKYQALDNRNSRGIAGHSMGAYGALRLSIKYPEIFGSVYAMSSVNLVDDRLAKVVYPDLAKKISDQVDTKTLDPLGKILLSKSLAFLPSETPPYFANSLYTVDNGNLILDSILWKQWSSNFIRELIKTGNPNLENLIIRFDHGKDDPLVSESREFSKFLDSAGINHHYSEYEGDHTNKIRERMEKQVLPFFSTNLEFK